MLIKKSHHIPYSEVTPRNVYLNRRTFLIGAAAIAGSAALPANPILPWLQPKPVLAATAKLGNLTRSPFSTTETQTPYKDVTTYNNFWEFGDQKDEPSRNAAKFKTAPWSVSVEGEVTKPRTFTMDEIAKLVQPTSKARYVAFETYYDIYQMPLAGRSGLNFPYVEGLRLDEAMHPLALLCVGMYGETLPNQDGAPVRMVVPWKYGYKSIKSLVKIRFAANQPSTTWNMANPPAYGFYSNVNPQVPNPLYSQAFERRLDGSRIGKRISTLMFNGYDQVAGLYSGMDLTKFC